MPLAAVIMGLVMIAFTTLNSFRLEKKIESFDEINVKRINIIENDGTIRMVISNKGLQHSGRMDGKNWEKRERPAGMIFFNDEGDECGGLVYQTKNTNKGKISGMSFTMDRYRDDQVLQLLNSENIQNTRILSERGLIVNDYPTMTGVTARNKALDDAQKITDESERKAKIQSIWESSDQKRLLFLGKSMGNSQGLFIGDKNGKMKMMIYVNDKGEPKIQTVTENGEIKDYLSK